MSPAPIHVVVLAAGQGTRMKSSLPKVLHRVPGGAMLDRVIRTAESLSPETLTVVVGHGADAIRSHLASRRASSSPSSGPSSERPMPFCRRPHCSPGGREPSCCCPGTCRWLAAATLRSLVTVHCGAHAAATVVTATVERPFGYGRIVRVDGEVARIVEERDASPAERQIREINSGIYAFDMGPLFEALGGIASQNAQGEFYLTDLVAITVDVSCL